MVANHAPILPQVSSASHLPLDAGRRLLVVSPHLDDAVMSCGEVLAVAGGATVVTVFAGRPPAGDKLTEWDAASGFGPGDDVIGARREEDRAALAALGATPSWLEHRDAQYGAPSTTEDIAADLEAVVDRHGAMAVLTPLGLFHDDHRQASDAAIVLMKRRADLDWFAYEEALYRTIPGEVQRRLSAIERVGVRATPTTGAQHGELVLDRKQSAVGCYTSQLRALATPERPGHRDADGPERYWWLDRG